ncbi:hypothetical protein FF80_02085 [Devosia sp. LC5]|uniref:hypothetical protein n=1 Tax=Devosia sp. LC5 TaxID=1502724 RepID=UPI0004E38C8E|nr:hypothetical protein [Devosia sp. LC5]KFC67689.1 hypothetical protein FF80_02085 [Devosia sp. LC5]
MSQPRDVLTEFDRLMRWLYVVPVLISMAFWLQGSISAESLLGGSPVAGLWGLVGASSGIAFRAVHRGIAVLAERAESHAKRLNEKIKLLAATVNVIALGCAAAAVVEPLRSGGGFSPLVVVLLLVATYAHIGAQRFLSLMIKE